MYFAQAFSQGKGAFSGAVCGTRSHPCSYRSFLGCFPSWAAGDGQSTLVVLAARCALRNALQVSCTTKS